MWDHVNNQTSKVTKSKHWAPRIGPWFNPAPIFEIGHKTCSISNFLEGVVSSEFRHSNVYYINLCWSIMKKDSWKERTKNGTSKRTNALEMQFRVQERRGILSSWLTCKKETSCKIFRYTTFKEITISSPGPHPSSL